MALGPRSWIILLAPAYGLYLWLKLLAILLVPALGSHSWPLPLVKQIGFRASPLLLVLSVLAFAHQLLASAPTPCLAGNHSQRLLLGVAMWCFGLVF